MKVRGYLLLSVLAGCSGSDESASIASLVDSAGIVIPDTVTVDGVLMMRHGPGALDRAAPITIDPKPLVVYRDDGNPDFDLTWAFIPAVLTDGRMVAVHRNGPPRMMLFAADGRPSRILARAGAGPGELTAPSGPVLVGRDTMLVVDDANMRSMLVTADGVQREIRHVPVEWRGCLTPLGLRDSLVVSIYACLRDSGTDSGKVWRMATPIVTTPLDHRSMDTVVVLPGWEMVSFETRYRGYVGKESMQFRFGRRVHAALLDSRLATTTGDWTIELRDLAGAVTGRISLDQPSRPVTEAMRAAQIDAELVRIASYRQEGMVDPAETRRIARETPFADSLPAWGNLLAGTDGTLWAVEYITPSDSVVMVTAFREDGAILGRLTIPRLSGPLWFDRDRVMLREEDGDGVVSFAVYRMVSVN